MPVTYKLDPDGCYIETVCSGELTFEEVLGHFRELAGDSQLPDRLDVLIDLEHTSTLPETDQLHSVVRELQELESQLRWGVCAVVARNDALYGMLRMFQVFAEGRFEATTVVRDRAEAEAWLRAHRAS